MSKATWLLLAIGVGGGAVAMHLTAQLREARTQNAKLQARIVELERAAPARSPFAGERAAPEPAPAPTQTQHVETSPKAPPAIVSAAPSPAAGIIAPASQGSREAAHRQMRAHMERERELLKDPEYRAAMLLQHRTMLPHQYPDLADELQLSPEEMDRFMTLLADQQLRSRDVYGLPLDPSATRAEHEEQQRKLKDWNESMQAEIRSELGEDKWRAWQDYQSTMAERYQVRELNQALTAQGAPLDGAQLKSLRQALASASKQQVDAMSRSAARARMMSPADARAARRVDWLEENLQLQKDHHRRMLEAASAVLTSEQLKVMEDRQTAQLRIQEAHIKMARAQAEAEARGEIEPASGVFVSGNGFIVSESSAH